MIVLYTFLFFVTIEPVVADSKINMSYFIFLYPRHWPASKRGGSNIISKWFNCPNYRGSAITITRR